MFRSTTAPRIAVVTAVMALTLLGGATTAGARSAGASPTGGSLAAAPTAPTAATDPGLASDPVVDQIIAETKVSRSEATVRARVESLSGRLAAAAGTAFGTRWGGLTVGTDSVLTLRVVRSTAADRSRVIALAGQLGIPTARVRTISSTFSQADLTAAATRVGDTFAAQHPTIAFSVTPAVATGEVQLRVANGQSAVGRSFVTARPRTSARAGGPQVPVRMSGEQQIGAASCSGKGKCNPSIRGGQQIVHVASGGLCTGGFVARSKQDHSRKYLVTAGHCTIFQGVWSGVTANGKRHQIGSAVKTNFRSGGDLGLIAISAKDYWKPNKNWVVVYGSDDTVRNERYPIRGVGVSQVGQRVCHTGSTTATKCGKVVAVGERIRYCDPKQGCTRMVTVNNMTRATDRVIPGDSGGPRYAAGLAYGITSGLTTYRENGRTVHYSLAVEASAIASQMNVELVTTS